MADIKAQLLITLDKAGNIGIEGPITDKVLCYGMLGVAHDAIRDYNEEQARRIIRPDAGALALVDPNVQ